MPRSEAYLDAPRALRRVRHREAFSDFLAGVAFRDGAAVSGMPASVLARLVGLGLPLDDLGPWEDSLEANVGAPSAPAPAPAPYLAALPPEPAPDDAPEVSPAHAAPPASSPLPRHVPPPARRR